MKNNRSSIDTQKSKDSQNNNDDKDYHKRRAWKETLLDPMAVKLGGPTLKNEDVFRCTHGIKNYARKMKDVIGKHQATDKEQPSEMLARETADSFMMKEHELLQPKLYKKLRDGGAGYKQDQ